MVLDYQELLFKDIFCHSITLLCFVGFPVCNFESLVRYLDSVEIYCENRPNMLVVAVGQEGEWTPLQFWAE